MPYVITEACQGTCDTACVAVCPVDAIAGPVPLDEITAVPPGRRREAWPRLQLYIDPDSCICCGACEPECPVGAIVEDVDAPAVDRSANAAFFGRRFVP